MNKEIYVHKGCKGDHKCIVRRCISARIPSKCVTDDLRFKTGGFNGLVNGSRGSEPGPGDDPQRPVLAVLVLSGATFFTMATTKPNLK